LLRLTTRVSHSKSIVVPHATRIDIGAPFFHHDRPARVMIPAHARPAHRRLRQKLAEIAEWNEQSPFNREFPGSPSLGIITSGVSFLHAREAAPDASMLKLGITYPLPHARIRRFVERVKRCVVIEEGDPVLTEGCLAARINVEGKPEMYRFGELNVTRVRRILAGDTSPEPQSPRGKPPELCNGCPHCRVFAVLAKYDCIVAGDIGCYTLGVLPPFEAMDSCVCMGAAIGVGLGLRHVLPPDHARRVVSVIGDSTFVHSGITGLVEMIYNPPTTGHVLLILDNGTTAMTGLQEHPGTGRTLDHRETGRVVFEDLARALGVPRVHVIDAQRNPELFEKTFLECLGSSQICVIVARSPCLLAARRQRRQTEGGRESQKRAGSQVEHGQDT
ncbi:MAG: thiamine pyrophosphate-dependent enzyme, partial [Kiritimatiellae bacterium]|nr:thiamine pyrophosphate-dependent enzyme [Kiritimatiellia bacterium]